MPQRTHYITEVTDSAGAIFAAAPMFSKPCSDRLPGAANALH